MHHLIIKCFPILIMYTNRKTLLQTPNLTPSWKKPCNTVWEQAKKSGWDISWFFYLKFFTNYEYSNKANTNIYRPVVVELSVEHAGYI